MFRSLAAILIIGFWPCLGLSKTTFVQNKSSIFFNGTTYIDPSGSQSKDEIFRLPTDAFKTPEEIGTTSLGRSKASVWFRADISVANSGRWFVYSTRPDNSLLEIYLKNRQNKWEQMGVSSTSMGRKDYLVSRLPHIGIDLQQGQNYELLVHIKNPVQLTMDAWISTFDNFQAYNLRANTIYYIYLGVVGSLILYNLTLYFTLFFRVHLYYGLFGASMLLDALMQGGFLEFYNINLLGINSLEQARLVSMNAMIFALLLGGAFVDISSRSKYWRYTFRGLLTLYVVVALLLWTPFHDSLRGLTDVCRLSAIGFILASSARFSTRKRIDIGIFFSAWATFTCFIIIWTLGNKGFIEKTYWVAFAPIYGNMIEMIIMAVAMSFQIKKIDRERTSASVKAKERDYYIRLLRIVCHDIKNPLAIIMGTVHLMQKKGDTSPKVNRIARASNALNAIIQKISEMEGIRSGKIKLKVVPISVAKVLSEVRFLFEERAKDKGVFFEVDFDESTHSSLEVMGDESSLIHEVLSNLISNAIKFTTAGEFVKLSVVAKADSVRFSVSDNGIGIPPKILDVIFDPNAQTSRKGTGDEKGTGFGMPLVQSFVDAMHGRIEIVSQTAENTKDGETGTTITVTLQKASEEKLTA